MKTLPALLSVVAFNWVVGCAQAQADRKDIWSAKAAPAPGVKEYYVSPDGKSDNAGSKEAPWDLHSAVGGRQPVAPGSVLWLRGGAYKSAKDPKIDVNLVGKDGAPIIVRAYPGERATLVDCGLTLTSQASYVWVWDLEMLGTTPRERRAHKGKGPPPGVPLYGAFNVQGPHCKGINLIIHDVNGGGAGSSIGAVNNEYHGCIIYDNGFADAARGHGHCFYLQNKDGVQTVANCIMSILFEGSYTLHAYGSDKTYVQGFHAEDNIAYGAAKGVFMIGGGRPGHDFKMIRNYLHGQDLIAGYSAANEDVELRDNVVKGTLLIRQFKKVVDQGNVRGLPDEKAVVIPNKYDPRRAHVAVFNGKHSPEVAVDVAAFLKPGDKFRLLDPHDVFGKPIREGVCTDGKITAPLTGEFAAFVLLKGER